MQMKYFAFFSNDFLQNKFKMCNKNSLNFTHLRILQLFQLNL